MVDSRHAGALTRNLVRDAIHKKCAGVSRKQARAYVDAVIEEICDALYRGEDVALYEFGKFCIRARDERAGFNPLTGEGMTIAPHKVVTFKPSHVLLKKMNES